MGNSTNVDVNTNTDKGEDIVYEIEQNKDLKSVTEIIPINMDDKKYIGITIIDKNKYKK